MNRRGHGAQGIAPGEKPKNFKHAIKRTIDLLRPERMRLTLIIILTAIGVALTVAGPKLLGDATNVVFNGVIGRQMAEFPPGTTQEEAVELLRAEGQDQLADMLTGADFVPGQGVQFGDLARVLLIVAGIYIASAIFQFVAGWIIRIVVQNLGWKLRRDAQAKIDRLPLSYLDKHSRGDLLSRVTNDVDNITQTLMQTLNSLFQNILMMAGIVGMMLWLSWQLALLSFVVVPLGLFAAGFIMKKAQPHFRAQWEATGDVSGTVEEAFTGHEVVTAFGLQHDFDAEFDQHNSRLRHSTFWANFISGLMMPTMNIMSNLGYVVVAVVGGIQVANGQISLGGVQAFIQYSRQLAQPMGQLASMANLLQSGAASAERMYAFLDADEMIPDAEGELPWAGDDAPHGHVEFRNVEFGYVPGKPVIRGLSFEARPGQTVAIVGPTGAGKTTLVNLLMRFYELDSGAIYVDGVDISTVSKHSLRERMGMVLQDTWLFEGTIYENIGFGREGASDSEIEAAAVAASADRIVRQLPEGYATIVDDEGEGISVGEKQLLTIARAFLADPPILILDEATSSVDTRTEVLVQEAMSKLQEGRTSFIIAHRLSTIRDADIIIVMEDGDVVEQGSHDELLERGGAYARLYQSQFAQPTIEEN